MDQISQQAPASQGIGSFLAPLLEVTFLQDRKKWWKDGRWNMVKRQVSICLEILVGGFKHEFYFP